MAQQRTVPVQASTGEFLKDDFTWDTPAVGTPIDITVANEATDTTCFPLFVTATTGDLAPKTVTSFTLNSNTGELGASKFSPTGDTAAGDAASLGYTAVEGAILTGQGSTNDVTIKNDADAAVLTIPTGTTNVKLANSLYLTEQAEADADVAGDGQIWVDTATPNELKFTDDTGVDYNLTKGTIRWLVFNLVEAGTDCAAATNIAGDFVSPIAGTILQSDSSPFYLYATNSTAGTTGTMVVDISIGGTSIMTTNKLDTQSSQKTSYASGTQPDLTTTSLSVGDVITIDIDSVHTTAAKGLTVYMAVRES